MQKKPWLGWLLFVASLVLVFLLGLLASSITQRRVEATLVNKPKQALDEFEPRNEVWGEAYPAEYETYAQMADTTFRSLYAGSATIDMLEEDPRLVILWAGYAFSKDYKQSRGHWYAVEDIRSTLRTGTPKSPEEGPMPNTCWTCKSPDVARMMKTLGPEQFYKGKWASLGHEVVNPIGCADCHNPDNMSLRISRPALAEALARQGRDVTKASHQEMRSLVCAQCHVEYYFKGDDKYLTFPWDKGFGMEEMEKYYDEYQFADWTHALSKAPMLKAQHPDYELYQLGIHAQRGVACADCHMPYERKGAMKVSSHDVKSPMASVQTSCQTCHNIEAGELEARVGRHPGQERGPDGESGGSHDGPCSTRSSK
ncbi:MAG: ammonia-forming cytochrome c nitrite reductase subunit c552, partial [Cytophagales bacterium]|nr:ammonia-forming cytochrome c nitrite reductase subunit c552 [Cytophagales bacterium]